MWCECDVNVRSWMLFEYVNGHGIRIPRCTSHSLIDPLIDVNGIRIPQWRYMKLNTAREWDSNHMYVHRIRLQESISKANQMCIAVVAIAFEYDGSECYSHIEDSNTAMLFWCTCYANRGRWIWCSIRRCRFDVLPIRIVWTEYDVHMAMSFWCECRLNSAMNIAIRIAVAAWEVHVNWIRWIASYRDSPYSPDSVLILFWFTPWLLGYAKCELESCWHCETADVHDEIVQMLT